MAKAKTKSKGGAKKKPAKKAAKKAPAKKAAKKAPAKKAAAKRAPKKAPAKKAAKPPAAKKPTTTLARGLELVEQVIASIDGDGGVLGGCGIPDHPATPLPADQLAALVLPNNRPLPPSLARFLAYDASYLGVLEGTPPRLAFRTFRAMMAEQFDPQLAEIAEFGDMLPGHCLVIPGGSDSRRFMYVGEPDPHGEYPVFVVDTDDVPYVCLAYPGLDVYLADGIVRDVIKGTYTDGFDDKVLGPMLADQARRNFGGFKSLDLQNADTEHLDGPDAVEAYFAGKWGS
jgi:hypothetical protein